MQPSIWGFSGTWPRVSGWPDTHSESARQAEQALGRSLRSLSRAAGPAFSPAAVRARLNFSTYWTLISLPQNLKAHKTLLRVSYLTSACFKVFHLTIAFRFILLRSRKQPFFWSWSRFSAKIRVKWVFWRVTIKKYADLLIVINPGRDLYLETALTGHSSHKKTCQTTSLETPVSTLCSNWLQLSRTNQSTGTTAGEYARPAVQSKLRELRRGLATLALCPQRAKSNALKISDKTHPKITKIIQN